MTQTVDKQGYRDKKTFIQIIVYGAASRKGDFPLPASAPKNDSYAHVSNSFSILPKAEKQRYQFKGLLTGPLGLPSMIALDVGFIKLPVKSFIRFELENGIV
jgi:hypothetical protein